jgi:hypothetical protein
LEKVPHFKEIQFLRFVESITAMGGSASSYKMVTQSGGTEAANCVWIADNTTKLDLAAEVFENLYPIGESFASL